MYLEGGLDCFVRMSSVTPKFLTEDGRQGTVPRRRFLVMFFDMMAEQLRFYLFFIHWVKQPAW